jgi:3-deoxy-manno-octulosonate cytidylyltransferase (CMP-KDO synthetase)
MIPAASAVGVIPARYASSRFPGKPLIDLEGKPMIQRVFERALGAASLSRVLVATDDRRIYDAVMKFCGEAVMTPADCPSGTDRMAFVARSVDSELFVNIQGDEPLIEPEEIDAVVRLLADDPDADVGTLVKRITSPAELTSPNTAKVVLDENGYALYFSRLPVPAMRGESDPERALRSGVYWKHIGIYGYRKPFLMKYSGWSPTPLEKSEQLEQLRVLEKGRRIKTAETRFEPVCVDTPEDAEAVRALLRGSPVRGGAPGRLPPA